MLGMIIIWHYSEKGFPHLASVLAYFGSTMHFFPNTGSHEVIHDGDTFQKQSHNENLQECLRNCCHDEKPRVMIFHHQNEQDEVQLLQEFLTASIYLNYIPFPLLMCLE